MIFVFLLINFINHDYVKRDHYGNELNKSDTCSSSGMACLG